VMVFRGEPIERGMDREIGTIRLNRIFEKHVENALLPENSSCRWKAQGPVTWARASS